MTNKMETIFLIVLALWIATTILPIILIAIGFVDICFVMTMYHVVVPILFFILFAIGIASAISRLLRQLKQGREVERLKQRVRIESNRLILPEETVVELGDVIVKGYWASTGRGGRTEYRSSVDVKNPEIVRTGYIDLNKLCSRPFFIYVNGLETILLDAPGLKVGSGEFKDIAVVCLEPSSIPEREVKLEVGDPNEKAAAKLKISPRGLDVDLTWVFQAAIQKKVIYDKDHGVYKVVEEYTSKPRARGARLEICVQTPIGKQCRMIASTKEVNKSVKMTIPFIVKGKILYMGGTAREVIKKAVEYTGNYVIAGYKPEYMTIRVILDVPMKPDIVREVPL